MEINYNYLDLFHGIGGFALGAYWAGMKFKNHLCSDIEPFCQKLYKLRFPDSIQLGDIKKIDYMELINKYGGKWIATGGFPCQPHSQAGKRQAANDERDLWPECFRMFRELRPEIALFENVPGLFTSDGGKFFNGILSDISSVGYDCEWTIISAKDTGADHERERIWIVAYPAGTRLQDSQKSKQLQSIFYVERTGLQEREREREVSDPTEYGVEGEWAGWEQESRIYEQKEISLCNSKSYTIKWPVEPSICRNFDGLPNQLYGYQGRLAVQSYERKFRLQGLGNSIVPQIAQLLFELIKIHL